MNDTTIETYTDRAHAMKQEAAQAALKELTKKFALFKEAVANGRESTVEAVNLARDMGDTIWEITGHEKLLPAEFNQLALALPDAGLAFAKECLSVRRQLDKPVTDYNAARPLWDKLLIQLDLIPKPARGEQKLHSKEHVEMFLASVIRINNESARLIKTDPIEQWPSFYRQKFINDAKPIHDLYEQAIALK